MLCAGSTLPLAKQSLDEASYKLSRAVAKLAGIIFRRLAFSYWIDNLGFLLREKLAAIFIKPSLGVSQLASYFNSSTNIIKFSSTFNTAPSSSFSGAVAGEKEDFCKGSFARTSFTLF
jgi:hypothetical protein